jgi:cytochrome P450
MLLEAGPHAQVATEQARTCPSPAGPVDPGEPTRLPPAPALPRLAQTLRFLRSPIASALADHARYGDVWQLGLLSRKEPFIATCHPDHVRSLFTADPDDAPSLTGESPLRPILGPNSVLTLIGERHLRQRKLLLPPFHGEAVARYVEMIEAVVARELDVWRSGETFALAPRMQSVTMEVIMRGVLGIEGGGAPSSPARSFYDSVRRYLAFSTKPLYQLIELQNNRAREPRGALRTMMRRIDRALYALIADRRGAGAAGSDGTDVFSLLLRARDEEGHAMTDEELRDELLTLILAGHETTANSLAWTFERLVRAPAAYSRLREAVRGGSAEESAAYVEATIHEGMRVRPVIPFVVRLARRPWRLGEYVLPVGTPLAVSIVAVHHRADVYPAPHELRPERFLDTKPGTYTWVPFGGGIRRCLGATLAMAEQRVVLREIAARVDLEAIEPAPERPRQRNVTTIPARGGLVRVARVGDGG